jgi:hypothetical protein
MPLPTPWPSHSSLGRRRSLEGPMRKAAPVQTWTGAREPPMIVFMSFAVRGLTKAAFGSSSQFEVVDGDRVGADTIDARQRDRIGADVDDRIGTRLQDGHGISEGVLSEVVGRHVE